MDVEHSVESVRCSHEPRYRWECKPNTCGWGVYWACLDCSLEHHYDHFPEKRAALNDGKV